MATTPHLTLTITNYLFIPLKEVEPTTEWSKNLKAFCEKQLNFFNPKIIELQRMGFSIWGTPKYINCFKALKSGWLLPTGFLDTLLEYCELESIEVEIIDQRVTVLIEPPACHITPKPEQQQVLDKMLQHDRVILEAKPGFGKTMAALLYFVARQQKTLVIVHTRSLLQQWQKRIQDYFDLVKGEMGVIGEGKWQVGDKITIASYQTLLSRGVDSIKKEFGLVIIDECHHVPAQTFTKVARGFSARYYLGLSATPFRKDKMEKLMLFYIGPIISSGQAQSIGEAKGELDLEKPKQLVIPSKDTHLMVRSTNFSVSDPDSLEFVQLGTQLIEDESRNQMIIKDVLESVAKQGKCLILSERVSHCEYLATQLQKKLPDIRVGIITGQISKKDREQLFEDIKAEKYQVLVATGSVIGEGFDWPAIDHLFLTYPFSWKGKLIQYVGRAQRLHPGKKEAFIFDYVDLYVPMLKAMYRKRVRAYQEMQIRPG